MAFLLFENTLPCDSEWHYKEAQGIDDILMQRWRQHRNARGRQVGNVIDEILIEKRQYTAQTLKYCPSKACIYINHFSILHRYCGK